MALSSFIDHNCISIPYHLLALSSQSANAEFHNLLHLSQGPSHHIAMVTTSQPTSMVQPALMITCWTRRPIIFATLIRPQTTYATWKHLRTTGVTLKHLPTTGATLKQYLTMCATLTRLPITCNTWTAKPSQSSPWRRRWRSTHKPAPTRRSMTSSGKLLQYLQVSCHL